MILSFCVGKYFNPVKTKLLAIMASTNKILKGDQQLCSIDVINNIPDDSFIIVGQLKDRTRAVHGEITKNSSFNKKSNRKNKSRISGIIFIEMFFCSFEKNGTISIN